VTANGGKIYNFYHTVFLVGFDQYQSCVKTNTIYPEYSAVEKYCNRKKILTLIIFIFMFSKGIHVIQTFLSESLSEEIQIKGRTARQGENGSYSMILSLKDLEKYLITSKNNEEHVDENKYKYLNEKRNTFFNLQYAENTKYVKTFKDKHNLTTQFIQNIFKGEMDLVKNFILKENEGGETKASSKTLILMDATSSMDLLLEQTKKTLETMFQRVSDVLKEANFSSDSFQIKIAVFRNYNSSKDMILQVKKKS
jgi:hypothetical protein